MHIVNKPLNMNAFHKECISNESGAIATFSGVVRAFNKGKPVQKIFYDCYGPLAERQIKEIIQTVKKTYACKQVVLKHRMGYVEVGEIAVLILVSSRHRNDAFLACRQIIEDLKRQVAIWKQEYYTDGSVAWIKNCCH